MPNDIFIWVWIGFYVFGLVGSFIGISLWALLLSSAIGGFLLADLMSRRK
jgi:hypothetical protein